jgi:hypothetical protein
MYWFPTIKEGQVSTDGSDVAACKLPAQDARARRAIPTD